LAIYESWHNFQFHAAISIFYWDFGPILSISKGE
jgi:hypothetical protein